MGHHINPLKAKPLVAGVILLGSASPAFSNPVGPPGGPILGVIMALICETLVIGYLLAKRKFRFGRITWTWFPITLVTFGLFFWASGVAGERWGLRSGTVLWFSSMLFLEVLVVLIEAAIIKILSAIRFYRDSAEPFPMKSALAISAVGNAVSLLIGLIFWFI
jgi:hypothetical protein